MTKHHLVQIAPVQTSAAFCERERDSAGRAKSEIPARTRPHCCDDVSFWYPILKISPLVLDNAILALHTRFPTFHRVMLCPRIPSHPHHPPSAIAKQPTFIIGAQKCTVLGPTLLFHSFIAAFCVSAGAAVLCARRAPFRDTCAWKDWRKAVERVRGENRVKRRGADMVVGEMGVLEDVGDERSC